MLLGKVLNLSQLMEACCLALKFEGKLNNIKIDNIMYDNNNILYSIIYKYISNNGCFGVLKELLELNQVFSRSTLTPALTLLPFCG